MLALISADRVDIPVCHGQHRRVAGVHVGKARERPERASKGLATAAFAGALRRLRLRSGVYPFAANHRPPDREIVLKYCDIGILPGREATLLIIDADDARRR